MEELRNEQWARLHKWHPNQQTLYTPMDGSNNQRKSPHSH